MLVGYVSDERYIALADVLVELACEGQQPTVARSMPSGAVYADIQAGQYRVTLVKPGYGSKRVSIAADAEKPHQFRLLTDGLLGYAWPKWVTAGDKAEFRVHSVEPYRLSLWRYGLRREFVRLLGWHDEHGPLAMMQITPDGDYTQTGACWNKRGYTNPHISQMAVAPEQSGLYYFHAQTPSGRFTSFPWVVAPRSPGARIAVLASTNTWNAYNNWGGRSNYVNAGGLPPEPVVNGRLDLRRYTVGPFSEWAHHLDGEFLPLSFDRPEPGNVAAEDEEAGDPIKGRLQSSHAPGEWRLLAWLEREGFSYDFYSEHQLHTGRLDLDAYRVLIFGVHPEYWSAIMYHRVKDWVYQRGGRLLYLGGNGVNCEVEYLDDSTIRLKSHLKSTGSFGMVDPNEPAKAYESRFHRTVESEANLLGVVSTDSGIMTGAPYRVLRADHWVFEGTGLKNGDVFGEHSLHERCPGGASGYETDKMSRHSPVGTVLLAKGLNPDDGGAEMVCYELPQGGAVFSAGSITWPASLLVDQAVSKVTANVLHTFLSG